MKVELRFFNEFEIQRNISEQINQLLQTCFPEIEYKGLDYYKQLSHYRILAEMEGKVVGHLGIDYRVMNLNGQPIYVFGVVALCVEPSLQRKGIGQQLMAEFEAIAVKYSNKIDCLFLVTDTPKYYEALGYESVEITTTWLKIDEHHTLGIGVEKIADAFFMVKQVSGKQWIDGDLDMLGYMY